MGQEADALAATTLALPTTRGAGTPALAEGLVLAGRYTIVRFIAAGGMGQVYEVDDAVLGERVALKTIRADVAAAPGVIDRFKREIHLARKVTHRNVCRIHEVGFHGEVPFLTMELLDGAPVSDRLRTGPISRADALPIVDQMVAALTAAHEAGVVHRDFKTGNVMLVDGGARAVVTDFGLARSVDAGADKALTGGGFVGTPSYMAPEQVSGDPVGPPADVFALGVVIYEMVTGRLPFVADGPLAAAAKRLTSAPAAPDTGDARWDAAILACLAREPAARPAITEVVPRLRGHVPTRRRARRTLVAVLAGLVLAAGASGVYLATRDERAAVIAAAPTGTPLERTREHLLRREHVAARAAAEAGLAAAPGDDALRIALAHAMVELSLFADATAQLDRVDRTRLSAHDRLVYDASRELAGGRWSAAADQLFRAHAAAPSLYVGALAARAMIEAGRHADADTLIRELTAAAGAADPPILHFLTATSLSDRAAYDQAIVAFERTIARARELGWAVLEGAALAALAADETNLGRFAEAADAAQRARPALASAGERRSLGHALNSLGLATWYLGQYLASEEAIAAAAELTQQAGTPNAIAEVNLAVTRGLRGQRAVGTAAIAKVRDTAPASFTPYLDGFGGWILVLGGEAGAARTALESAMAGIRGGDARVAVTLGTQLTRALLLAGDLEEAHRVANQWLTTALDIGYRPFAALLRAHLAAIESARGNPAQAASAARVALADADDMGFFVARIHARLALADAVAAADPPAAAALRAEAVRLADAGEDPDLRHTARLADATARGDRDVLAAISRDASAGEHPGHAVLADAALAKLTGGDLAPIQARAAALGLALR